MDDGVCPKGLHTPSLNEHAEDDDLSEGEVEGHGQASTVHGKAVDDAVAARGKQARRQRHTARHNEQRGVLAYRVSMRRIRALAKSHAHFQSQPRGNATMLCPRPPKSLNVDQRCRDHHVHINLAKKIETHSI